MQGMGGLFDFLIVVTVVIVWWLIELRLKRLDKKPPASNETVSKDDEKAAP